MTNPQSSDHLVESKESTPIDETSGSRDAKMDQHMNPITTVEIQEECAKPMGNFVETEKNRGREVEGYSGSEDSDSNQNKSQGVKIPKERRPYYESTEKYRKTLRLSSTQIVCVLFVFTFI